MGDRHFVCDNEECGRCVVCGYCVCDRGAEMLRLVDAFVAMGESIQRQQRRAEVAGLVDDVCFGAHSIAMWNFAFGVRSAGGDAPSPKDESERFRAALSRLARLAGGGA